MSARGGQDGGRARLVASARDLLDLPAFTSALVTVTIGTVLFTHAIRSILGWPGLIGALALLVGLASAVLAVRREQFEWRGILPITLLAFLGWSAVSIFWSQYQWSTLSGVLYQVAIALLGVFVAVSRDLIQIVRAFGDVFRVVLATSLIVEVLSGIIFDVPIRFLGVTGGIAVGGPIQGMLGSRNMLGIVTLLAVITFAIEGTTRSIRRNTALASLVLAGIVFVLSRSPVASISGLAVALAAVALLLLRRAPEDRRPTLQIGVAIVTAVALLAAYLARSGIVSQFNAGGELSVRLALWNQTWILTRLNFLEGWGFVGAWRSEILPFLALRTTNGRVPSSALNAYLDVWFQLGLVGLAIFVLLIGLALVRAWLVASNKRTVAYVWPALVLVALAVTAAAESSVLIEYCWLLLVVCTVKAAQVMSWRNGLR